MATFPRSIWVWPYARGPYYGDVEVTARREPGVLRTRVGSFRLGNDLPFPEQLRTTNKLGQLAAQYFVVQLNPEDAASGSAEQLRQVIESNGGAVLESIPVSAVIARLTPAAQQQLQGVVGLLAVEPYHPAFKLDPLIGRVPLADAVKAVSEVYSLEIQVFAGENATTVAQRVTELGGRVTNVDGPWIKAELHRSRLGELASIEAVESIGEDLPRRPLAEETTTTMQTGRWNFGATPFHDAGVDGGGNAGDGVPAQILMVLDTGVQLDAGDLSNTRTSAGTASGAHRKVIQYSVTGAGLGDALGCDADGSGGYTHGHMVSSTALGNATNVPGSYGASWFATDDFGNQWKLDGVAPKAKLVIFDAERTPVTGCNPSGGVGGSPDFSVGTLYVRPPAGNMQLAYVAGARTFNFSWGANSDTYNSDAVQVDQFLFDHLDAMLFVSAGNAGADNNADGIPDLSSLGTPATAKNALAIGSTGNANDSAAGGLGNNASPQGRSAFSSTGPAPGSRTAPQVMAPGQERGTMGVDSEFSCRSLDNDQSDPVQCDVADAKAGTSFASPAAAGAALLVRDYFAQGFYPDGTRTDSNNATDKVANVSGALVRAILSASADWLGNGNTLGQNTTIRYRFNNEQGYGRIQLDNVLPLENWSPGAAGLLVADGGIAGGVNNIAGLSGDVNAVAGETDTGTFKVCNSAKELRVALSWIEDSGQDVVNDLDLELQAPSGKIYHGNYFTDDDNRDGIINATTEDCPGIGGTGTGTIDASPWSLPRCTRTNATTSPHDTDNSIEAVFLSPDADADTVTTDAFNQIELGTWTVRVIGRAGGASAAQRYAVAIAGGVCLGSSVKFDQGTYTCNERAKVTVSEVDDPGVDPTASLNATEVASRTTVEVLNSVGTVVDTEMVTMTKIGTSDQYESNLLPMTDGTARDTMNGALDVRNGDTIRVTYNDETSNVADPAKKRTNTGNVRCKVAIGFGQITFAQFGADTTFLVNGGCERNARGFFELDSPDRYMDAGEQITYDFAFASSEQIDLDNVQVALRCVDIDGDSPASCLPGSTACADPDRTNNTSCNGGAGPDFITVLDSPKTIGFLPASAAISANFALSVNSALAGTPKVEMVLEVTAKVAGKTAKSVAVNRHRLNVDEQSLFYSTDFPTGGTEVRDYNNNETEENPTTFIGNFLEDYRFETRTWSDLTAAGTDGVTQNTALLSPWNFDATPGGFQQGIVAASDSAQILDVISQWGEDKNYNNVHDGFCTSNTQIPCNRFPTDPVACAGLPTQNCTSVEDRDPVNNALDRNWATRGGCGWQTRAPGTCSGAPAGRGCYVNSHCAAGQVCTTSTCVGGTSAGQGCDAGHTCAAPGTCTGAGERPTGGIWHTGGIGATTGTCLVAGGAAGQCQQYETVSGDTGQRTWFESLITPVMSKVNSGTDVDGDPTHIIEIMWWAWNQSIDISDNNVAWSWEFDTNTDKLEPVDLLSDGTQLNIGGGEYGPIHTASNPELTDGWSMFANINAAGNSINGTVGGNRVGDNSCFFEGAGTVPAASLAVIGLAKPLDDDVNNDGDGTTDEYVQRNGPIRNMNIFAFNGPDMRFQTLEDIFQATGTHFQAGIGFLNFEKNVATDPDPTSGFGISVDDVVVEWREYSLVPDAATCTLATATCHIGGGACTSDANCPGAGNFCGGGACASVDLKQGNLYQGSTSLTITVMEQFPSNNDCNNDGDRTDVGIDDQDCNNNGTNDLFVTAKSDTEPLGERVLCERTANPNEYRGELTLSTAYNVPGVLFIQQAGVNAPVVNVIYQDINDGTGSICENDVDPTKQGSVEAATTVFIDDAPITVLFTPMSDNKDNDGWADNNEDVTMKITVQNKSLTDFHNVVARLATNDPKISCIINPVLSFGDLNAGQIKTSTNGFLFKVGDVHRVGPLDVFAATFSISMTGDEFDSLSQPQNVTVDLDLDATLPGGTTAGTFFEGFEGGTLGSFQVDDLDSTSLAGQHGGSLARSDGWRCPYSDPDWVNSNPFGNAQATVCFLSNNAAHVGHAVRWSVNDPGDVDGGRAYSGSRSLYYGINPATIPAADEQTTPSSAMEAASTTNPINLGVGVCSNAPTTACAGNAACPGGTCNAVAPELSFKHMISLLDWRTINANFETSADRAVAHVQFANPVGSPVGDWIKLSPYQNVYDSQAYDLYFNCDFDPADDGNTEETFFDPTDPDRRLGPSSTCFPDFSYVVMGDTFENNAFSPLNIGRASDPPGLQGSLGPGTWIETKATLERFRGRSLRLRFLATSLSLSSAATWQGAFNHNPDPGDDGWWIDDITVTNTVSAAATLATEGTINPVVACGTSCTTVTVAVAATPGTSLGAPGEALELDASGTTADRCVNGTLQFQFKQGSTILQDWSDNATFVDAPTANITYTVGARCSSLTSCTNTRNVTIGVACPSSGTLGGPFQTIRAPNKTSFTWAKPAAIDFVRGRLQAAGAANDVRDLGTFTGTVISSGSAGAATSIAAATDPVSGDMDYYLVQVDDAVGTGPECNRISTWSSGSPAEDTTPGRDATLP